jgi:prolycopene isomerase
MAIITADRVFGSEYEVVVVGAGLGGLTAACLLAKRGISVLLVEQHCLPGGACTSFRREGRIFDCGAALIFGFGKEGYHLHRTLMNFLEEGVTVIPKDKFFRLDLAGREILAWKNLEKFLGELEKQFPDNSAEIRSLYGFLVKFYDKYVKDQDLLTPPSELSDSEKVKMLFSSPLRVMRLRKLLSQSATDLMGPYIKSQSLLDFYDKLTASYAYITMKETPAIMALTMFVDNHAGGTYYVAGSAQTYSNTLEKAFEKYGGTILYRQRVRRILFNGDRVSGVQLQDGTEIRAERVVSNTTVWNLYFALIPEDRVTLEQRVWANSLVPTYPAMVLYAAVDKTVFPRDINSVEYFVSNPKEIDMGDITMYIPTVDDHSLGPGDEHIVTIFSPAPNQKWPRPYEKEYQSRDYYRKKEEQAGLILREIERRIPGFRKGIRRFYVATPSTIERYTLKTGGCVGGPKQMMGQELTKRLHAKTDWPGLYACGDSTTMGMGMPAVTASGFGAANIILREMGKKEYHHQKFDREYVNYIESNPKPIKPVRIDGDAENARLIARECQQCENQPCRDGCPAGVDIAGFIRRIEAGNYGAAARQIRETNPMPEICGYACPSEPLCEKACVRVKYASEPVQIRELHKWVAEYAGDEGWSVPVAKLNGQRVCVVGCEVDGLVCAHYLSRLGYEVDLLDEASSWNEASLFREVPKEVTQREVSALVSPIRFKGSLTFKDGALVELSRDYDAVYVSGRSKGENGEGNLAVGLRNVLVGEEKPKADSKYGTVTAIANGRKAAVSLHRLLQEKNGNSSFPERK